MSLVGQSLNAVSSAGPGSAIFFDTPKKVLSLQVSATGSPTSVDMNLEGSLDGVTFVPLWTLTGLSPLPQLIPYPRQGSDFLIPVIAIRANLKAITGGTSPTVSAWVAAED